MAMVAVGLTAAILFFLGASTFLLLIAFFSTYLVLVGWRFAKNRRGDIGAVDRWLLIMGAVGGIGLSAMAAWIAISGDAPLGTSRGFAVVPAIFAAVLIGLVVQQRMLQSGEKGPGQAAHCSSRDLHGRWHHRNGDRFHHHGVRQQRPHLAGSDRHRNPC